MGIEPTVHTLHRYWIWADRMRLHFEQVTRDGSAGGPDDSRESIDSFMYMALWYATLYTVIEGWRRLNLNDPVIDQLLTRTDNVRRLERFRHGVAHFQPKYFDARFLEFMERSEFTVPWVRALHSELGHWFLAEFERSRRPRPTR